MAEALTPGQGDQLLQIAGLDLQINNNEVLDQTIDNEMIKKLKKIMICMSNRRCLLLNSFDFCHCCLAHGATKKPWNSSTAHDTPSK